MGVVSKRRCATQRPGRQRAFYYLGGMNPEMARLGPGTLLIAHALEEALRLIAREGWRPAAIIGMPVGFIGVEEAKRHLLEQTWVPYLTCVGRKGGSAVTAAAINALVEWTCLGG